MRLKKIVIILLLSCISLFGTSLFASSNTMAALFGASKTAQAAVISEALSAGRVTLSWTSKAYSGAVQKPSVIVKNAAGQTLTLNSSYSVKWSSESKYPGTYTVTVTGQGRYSGTVTKSYKIVAQSLKSSRVKLSWKSATYNGSVQKPTVVVESAQGKTMTEGKSYTVSYQYSAESKYPGTYTVKAVVTGIGNFTGTVTKTFTYTIDTQPVDASRITLSWDSSEYNCAVQKPAVTVRSSQGGIMTLNSSYKVDYSAESKYPGTYTVTVTGKGYYSGTAEKTYTIERQSLEGATVTVDTNGKVTVKNKQGGVLSGTSFTATYSVDKVTVTGKGYYTGSKTVSLSKKEKISAANVKLSWSDAVYNADVQKPNVTVKNAAGGTLTKDVSYTVSYSNENSKRPGSYTVTVTGCGKYDGTVTKTYRIEQQALRYENAAIDFYQRSVTVWNEQGGMLTEGSSYTVEWDIQYDDAYNPVSVLCEITGKGNYTGVVGEIFPVEPLGEVILSDDWFVYDTFVQSPAVSVLDQYGVYLTEGIDYSVSYSNPNSRTPGYYTVTVSGLGSYVGQETLSYTIERQELCWDNVWFDEDTYEVIVKNEQGGKLTKGSSFVTEWQITDDSDWGTEILVTATGKGNYTGTVERSFLLTDPRQICAVDIADDSFIYNTRVQKPEYITVRNNRGDILTEGIDYIVFYDNENSRAPGRYGVSIEGIGDYCTGCWAPYWIDAQELNADSIWFDEDTYEVIVKNEQGGKLTEGSSFVAEWEVTDVLEWGTEILVSVTGKGNYTGTAEKTFYLSEPKMLCSADIADDHLIYNTRIQRPESITVRNNRGDILTEGIDYIVSYETVNSKAPGMYYVYVEGIGDYGYGIWVPYWIDAQELRSENIWFDWDTYEVIVKNEQGGTLTEGVSYTAVYHYMDSPYGETVDVDITGRGKYTGTVSMTFGWAYPG